MPSTDEINFRVLTPNVTKLLSKLGEIRSTQGQKTVQNAENTFPGIPFLKIKRMKLQTDFIELDALESSGPTLEGGGNEAVNEMRYSIRSISLFYELFQALALFRGVCKMTERLKVVI